MAPQFSYSPVSDTTYSRPESHHSDHIPLVNYGRQPQATAAGTASRSTDHLNENVFAPLETTTEPFAASLDPQISSESTTYDRGIITHKTTKGSRGFDWSGSWFWEICGATFSIVCIGLLIAFLKYVDGSLYYDWQYSVSPNAVASIIVTIAKSAMLIPISSCLSQLKWNGSRSVKPIPLYNLQVLDQASRGPWGAVEVFWRLRPGLATIGATLMILSVAVDPFAQQILSFPTLQVEGTNETAYAQSAHQYWPHWAGTSELMREEMVGMLDQYKMDPTMQLAVVVGLADTYKGLEPTCPTGNCNYSDFVSLGICSECDDITTKVTQKCLPWCPTQDCDSSRMDPANSTLDFANCTYTSPGGESVTPGIISSSPTPWNNNSRSTVVAYTPWISVGTGETLTEDLNPIASFMGVKYNEFPIYSPENNSVPQKKPAISECSISFCERQYTNNYLSANHRYLSPSKTQNLYLKTRNWNGSHFTLVPTDGRAQLSENSTYSIRGVGLWSLQYFFVSFFVDTLLSEATALSMAPPPGASPGIRSATLFYNSKNLSESMANMATSMTDTMRMLDTSTQVSGKAYVDRSFIHVRWPWITFPVTTVFLSVILLVITALSSKRSDAVLWKSSVLPLLAGNLETHPGHGLGPFDHVDTMIDASKKIKIVMREQDPLVFGEDERK